MRLELLGIGLSGTAALTVALTLPFAVAFTFFVFDGYRARRLARDLSELEKLLEGGVVGVFLVRRFRQDKRKGVL